MSKIKKEPTDNWMRIIKQRRIQEDMTVDDLRVRLENHGCTVARKTIYGWECGASRPDVNTFLAICKILKISDLRVFSDTPENSENAIVLNDTEVEIIKKYRKTKQIQQAFDKLLNEEINV